MGHAIAHRGPDNQGIFLSEDRRLGLVHQRLAIVDLDKRANQPMLSECGRFRLVFNGEIYNHVKLRKELETLGHRFRSESDTEVLLNAFIEWGPSSLSRLQGMFAFGVCDQSNRSLFLARDRIGIKPLFYTQLANGIAFCSDLKAFQPCERIAKKIDRRSLWQYMYYNYVPQPRSVFADIFKVLPGHSLSWSASHGVQVAKYWDIAADGPKDNLDDWAERFREKLSESVNDRMMSDVPVGAFLSGGLDSSAIVSHISRNDVQTFTIGFQHQSNTLDLTRAVEMAEFRVVRNTRTILDETALDEFEDLVDLLDEPMAESSMMALYCNFKIARKAGIKVILSGDGADEVLGGYGYLFRLLNFQSWNNVPKQVWRGLLGCSTIALSRFSPASRIGKVRDIYIERSLRALNRCGMAARHELMISGDNTDDLLGLGLQLADATDTLSDETLNRAHAEARQHTESDLEALLYAEVKVPLVNKHLTKLDRASMANGVEARVPFLDHELVELAFQMPESQKNRKAVLKASLDGMVPASILGDSKRGFNVPMHRWLQDFVIRGDWQNLWADEFEDVGLATKESVRRLVEWHLAGKRANFYTLWSLYVLRLWLRSNRYSI